MRVQFDATLDDFVDVMSRCLARSGKLRSWRLDWLSTQCFIVWLAIYALLPGSTGKRTLIAVIGAAIGVCIFPFFNRSSQIRRLREMTREQIGSDGPVPILVELSEQGISTKQLKTQIFHEWSRVAAIEETDDSIDFFMHDGSATIVRKRAFTSAEEKDEFLKFAQKHFEAARQAPSFPKGT